MSAGRFGGFCGSENFFGDIAGLIRVKIHGDFGAACGNKEAHHALGGWANLEVGFDVAFVVNSQDDVSSWGWMEGAEFRAGRSR